MTCFQTPNQSFLTSSARRCLHPLAIAVAVLSLGQGVAQANLLENGGFEQGLFTPNGDATVTLNIGDTTMTGWTVFGDSIAWIGLANPFGLSPAEGNKFLDLSDYSTGVPFGGVQQAVSTVAGVSYTLSFDFGSSTFWGRPGELEVSVDGAAQTFISPAVGGNNDWASLSLNFVAAGPSTLLAFRGANGSQYIGLDNVVLTTAVPEPGTTALLLAGMGLLGWRRRVGR